MSVAITRVAQSQNDPVSRGAQTDPQDFERLLMVEPILTVRDLRIDLSARAGQVGPIGDELLRNYMFNISQGIIQRVSRFFDALVLIGESSAGDGFAAGVNGGGVMGFGRKSNVYNQEKSARNASGQDAEVAALKAQIAEMQAPTAPSAALRALCDSYEYSAPFQSTFCTPPSAGEGTAGQGARRAETRADYRDKGRSGGPPRTLCRAPRVHASLRPRAPPHTVAPFFYLSAGGGNGSCCRGRGPGPGHSGGAVASTYVDTVHVHAHVHV